MKYALLTPWNNRLIGTFRRFIFFGCKNNLTMNSHHQLDSIRLINQKRYITRSLQTARYVGSCCGRAACEQRSEMLFHVSRSRALRRESAISAALAVGVGVQERECWLVWNQLTTLLKTYNCYYEDQKNMQLTYDQDQDRQLVVSGLLEIFWGVKRPIRFKIQDEKLNCTSPIELPEPLGSSRSKSGMIRWGEFDDLYRIGEIEETANTAEEEISLNKEFSCYDTLRPKGSENLDSPSLYRTMSDAALVKKRVKSPAAEGRDLQHHRFSINGHFYNYKTSIFTPAFGSQTKVCVNSLMKTEEVIEQLLHKFKIENNPHEFALYIIHASGEKKRIRDTDSPMWERLLQGPSGKIARMFLMDRDAEEVTSDVAQYIKFNGQLLEAILSKLNEEEEREIQKTVAKYRTERSKLLQHLSKKLEKTETTV